MTRNKSPAPAGPLIRVAFLMDERLSHDRKAVFHRIMIGLKSKFAIDILSSKLTEDQLLAELEKGRYGLVLLPWYHYVGWKKIEAHFGSLRMQGSTVAGYFADAVLPFEFSHLPNYHRFLLLDFYRFDGNEIEWMLQSLLLPQKRSGLSGLFSRNTTVYFDEWYDDQLSPTRSIDTVIKHPILQNATWAHRLSSLQMYLTALRTVCFQNNHNLPSHQPAATLEMAEFNKRLAIKLLFESSEHTLHSMMKALHPHTDQPYSAFRELSRHADYLRVHQFPESQQIEITALFLPTAPVLNYPNELRGWWIEPLNKKFAKTTEEELFIKRQPIIPAGTASVSEQLHQSAEALRTALLQLANSAGDTQSPEDRESFQARLSTLKFLVQELDKKVLQKKVA